MILMTVLEATEMLRPPTGTSVVRKNNGWGNPNGGMGKGPQFATRMYGLYMPVTLSLAIVFLNSSENTGKTKQRNPASEKSQGIELSRNWQSVTAGPHT